MCLEDERISRELRRFHVTYYSTNPGDHIDTKMESSFSRRSKDDSRKSIKELNDAIRRDNDLDKVKSIIAERPDLLR